MVDFRKTLLLVALLVAMTCVASAQTSFVCQANTAQPPAVRYEGLAEEVGQVEIECRNGTPTAATVAIPKVNIQIFLGTNVTSRLLNNSTASEALLLIDEPTGDTGALPAVPRLVCPSPGDCTITAATSDGSMASYDGQPGHYNVFQGTQTGPASITWFGVPLNAPGTNVRKLRIVNVRANANMAGLSSSLLPNDIRMVISISGTGGPSLTNPVQTVAFVQKGLSFKGGDVKIYNQCEEHPLGTDPYTLSFTENFGNAFRPNLVNNASNGDQQNVIGAIYNTEAMFVDNVINGVIGDAGRATQGTRLWAKITNIPTGVAIYAQDRNSNWSTTVPLKASLVTSVSSSGSGGSFSLSPTGSNVQLLTDSATTREAYAVWEVLDARPGAIDTFNFEIFVVYDDSPLPGLGTATVAGGYAPVSTVGTASRTEPAPRFVIDEAAADSFTINPCQTNLLFPFIAFDGKFDTGIAISNTSKDPYGTPNQKGTCRIWFYGSPADTDKTTSIEIEAGKQLVFTLSGGNSGAGITGFDSFVGYAIARCNFQYAHGYAFISDVGANELAQGYLALILDTPMSESLRRNKKLTKSETLGQ